MIATLPRPRPPADLNADELIAEARTCLDAIEQETHPLATERAAARLAAVAKELHAVWRVR